MKGLPPLKLRKVRYFRIAF
ncbi:hypothetical protein [Mesorhizobium sp. LSHC426A00]|nr:hypothetical protein [Mesorhizobium sp. LSHC426A00]